MDFDGAKENIQPLAAGRNASILQATLSASSPQELLLQREKMEDAIRSYDGSDPLEPWYAYISWLEQSFPSGGKDSGLNEVLSKCLLRFETDERYFQDRRMIKLLIKHIDNMKDPTECYQLLLNAGIGTMVADFYICWAYYYDKSGNARKADEIFRLGITCRAQPLEDLKEAHQHFGFTVGQRMMYQGDEVATANANQQLHERRLALTSLRGQCHKAKVGSIRTGAAVQSFQPGTVQLVNASSAGRNNAQVPVFKDENVSPTFEIGAAFAETVPKPVSAIRSLVDAGRNQENEKEPGPWNNAHDKKKSGKLFSGKMPPKGVCFNIHADDESDSAKTPLEPPIKVEVDNRNKPFKYPVMFYAENLPQRPWITPVTIENAPDANTLPHYNKCFLYPRPNMEFSPEELCAYRYFKRRGIVNEFTEKMDGLWSTHDITAGVRQYPNFAKCSRPQGRDALDEYFQPGKIAGLTVAFDRLYDSDQKEEFSIEELYAQKMKRNSTIIKCTDMEETIVVPSEGMQRRKSFFPTRLSIAPRAMAQCRPVTEQSPQIQSDAEREEMPATSASNNSNNELGLNSAAAKNLSKDNVLNLIEIYQDTPKPNLPTWFEDCSLNLKTPAKEKRVAPTDMKSSHAIEISEDTDTKQQQQVDQALNKKHQSPAQINHEHEKKSQAQTMPCEKEPAVSRPFEIFEDSTKQIVNPPASYSFKVPTTQPIGEHEHRKIQTQNDENDPEIAVVTSEKELNPPKTFLPFEIYEDTTQTDAMVMQKKHAVENPANFCFKAPVVRNAAKTSRLPSEVHVEEPPVPMRPVALFDADETCSTQTFNIFLKSQPMSTPKAPLRVRARQFGTELTASEPVVPVVPTTEPIDQMKDDLKISPISAPPLYEACSDSDAAGAPTSGGGAATPSYLQKQLSTILETSEHGSTHGTHTTGASTKSTFSSPEMEGEVYAISTRITMPRIELETVEEQSSELSLSKIDNNSKVLPSQPVVAPEIMRIQEIVDKDMCGFEDFGKPRQQVPQVGNFTRLEECEDTTGTYAHLPSIRFQDDKTETVPKMPLSKFQDDKTETISKILFEENKTGAIPKATIAKRPLTKSDAVDDPMLDFLTKTPPRPDGSKLKDLSQRSLFQMNDGKSQFADVLSSPKNSAKSFDKPTNEGFGNATRNESLGFRDISVPKIVFENRTELYGKDNSVSKAKNESHGFRYLASLSNDTMSSKKLTSDESRNTAQISTKSIAKDVSMDFRKLSCKSPTNDVSMGLNNLGSPCFLSASKVSTSGVQKDKSQLTLPEKNQSRQTSSNAHLHVAQQQPPSAPFFELNAETEMFAPNLSMIKNSTWLPCHEPAADPRNKSNGQPPAVEKSLKAQVSSSIVPATEKSSASAATRNASNAALQTTAPRSTQGDMLDVDEMSIYYKKTPRTPNVTMDVWHISSDSDSDSYTPPASDPDATQQMLEQSMLGVNINPFNPALAAAFLENIDFTQFLQNLPTCQFVRKLPSLVSTTQMQVHDVDFEITKPIGKGAYGVIFSGLNKKTGQKCAFKQERPPNYWEYYICLEVQSRIKAEEMLAAYMSVEYALIGQNASIFIAPLSPYGSLIDVCNKVKKYSGKNVDEYVVMYLTCELLEIIDHLHAVGIIHADIKADNFLVMRRLRFESKERAVQLIDFGVSIDMQQFKSGQTFDYVSSDDAFKCVEMREGRSWSYQLDLYGLAGVIHALLFGKYMEIEKRGVTWTHKSYMPRYFRKQLWDNIFQSLLNVRDQNSMPNLQYLRSLLKTELAEKEGYVTRKITEFNLALY